MALKTGRMRVRPRRDREGRPGTCWLVAIGTVGMRRVLRVVKLCIERPERWKFFHRTGRRVRMADSADLSLRLLEMLDVATRARDVAGELHLGFVILAGMTNQAREPGMLFIFVAEI